MDIPVHEKISTVNVWWEEIKFHIPVYMVKGQSIALIDAGPPQRTPGGLAKALEPFSVKPGDIASVLLTHGHLDHVGGLPELKSAGSPQIVISKEDAFYLQDHGRAFDEFYAIGDRMLSGKEDLSEAKAGFLMGAGPEYTPDRIISDGGMVDLGGGVELKAVHLPGHSMGSTGYYLEKDGVMVCGDSIPCLGGSDGSVPIIMDLFAYRKTIERLLGIPINTLVFTHGYRGKRLPASPVKRGPEVKEHLTDAMEMADRLVDALKKEAPSRGAKPFPQLVDTIIAAMPPEMGFAPLAKQFTPHFSASTIYWGLERI
jgi:glyoxylase-like metal-dependent hydrolase (beta-lactamase superfamily II)